MLIKSTLVICSTPYNLDTKTSSENQTKNNIVKNLFTFEQSIILDRIPSVYEFYIS